MNITKASGARAQGDAIVFNMETAGAAHRAQWVPADGPIIMLGEGDFA